MYGNKGTNNIKYREIKKFHKIQEAIRERTNISEIERIHCRLSATTDGNTHYTEKQKLKILKSEVKVAVTKNGQ